MLDKYYFIKKMAGLLLWVALSVISIKLIILWNPAGPWLNALSILANVVQVGSTFVMYKLFTKIHFLHKHVKGGTQDGDPSTRVKRSDNT